MSSDNPFRRVLIPPKANIDFAPFPARTSSEEEPISQSNSSKNLIKNDSSTNLKRVNSNQSNPQIKAKGTAVASAITLPLNQPKKSSISSSSKEEVVPEKKILEVEDTEESATSPIAPDEPPPPLSPDLLHHFMLGQQLGNNYEELGDSETLKKNYYNKMTEEEKIIAKKKIEEEVNRIKERKNISQEEKDRLNQMAIMMDAPRLARQIVNDVKSNDYEATLRLNKNGSNWEENNLDQYYSSSSSVKFSTGDFNFNQDVDEDTLLFKAYDEVERIKQRLLAKANSADPSPSFPPRQVEEEVNLPTSSSTVTASPPPQPTSPRPISVNISENNSVGSLTNSLSTSISSPSLSPNPQVRGRTMSMVSLRDEDLQVDDVLNELMQLENEENGELQKKSETNTPTSKSRRLSSSTSQPSLGSLMLSTPLNEWLPQALNADTISITPRGAQLENDRSKIENDSLNLLTPGKNPRIESLNRRVKDSLRNLNDKMTIRAGIVTPSNIQVSFSSTTSNLPINSLYSPTTSTTTTTTTLSRPASRGAAIISSTTNSYISSVPSLHLPSSKVNNTQISPRAQLVSQSLQNISPRLNSINQNVPTTNNSSLDNSSLAAMMAALEAGDAIGKLMAEMILEK